MMNPHTTPPIRPLVAYGAICIAWLLTRAFSFLQSVPWQYWEIWEARKLLEYGFWARHGGIINVHFMTGLLAEPEKFNYVNHPYPILWVFTFFYYLFGAWGAFIMSSALGLISALAVFPALKILFSPKRALLGTFLFLLAPTTILMDVNTNIISLGAIGWPFLMIVLAKLEKRFTIRNAFLFAGIVFVLGQISWFTYTLSATIFIALIFQILATQPQSPTWMKRSLVPLIAGGVATLFVLLIQVVYYTFDLSEVVKYASGQSGSEAGVSTLKMAIGIGIRTALSTGPALLLGGALGVIFIIKRHSRHWMEWIAIAYLFVFAGCSLLLPRFFFREVTMYEYLVFPLIVATLSAMNAIRNKAFDCCLVLISLAGLAYPIYQASIPVVSQTARNLASIIQDNTSREEILATNIESQKYPFASWDVGSRRHTAMLSNRMIRWGINSERSLGSLPGDFKVSQLEFTYVYCDGSPVQQTMKEHLNTKVPFKTIHVELPPEPLSAATRVRSLYWKITGKHQVEQDTEPQSSTFDLKFYQMTINVPHK
jgi:hypothetical protein